MGRLSYLTLDAEEVEQCEAFLLIGKMAVSQKQQLHKIETIWEEIQEQKEKEADLILEVPEEDANAIIYCIKLARKLSKGKRTVLMHHYGIALEEEEWNRLQAMAMEQFPEGETPEWLSKLEVKLHNKEWRQRRKRYIADCHFFHESLNVQMDMRGFPSGEEMNRVMIERWNETVRPQDEVFILGDFSVGRGELTTEILRQLKGMKHLIVGNHDRFAKEPAFDRSLFYEIVPYMEMTDLGRKVVLSHYPTFCYKGQYKTDSIGEPITHMLYGHVHNTRDERLVDSFIRQTRSTRYLDHDGEEKRIPCSMINCFCMFSDYRPLTLEEWLKIDQERRQLLGSQAQEGPLMGPGGV